MHCGCCGKPGGTVRLVTRDSEMVAVDLAALERGDALVNGARCVVVHEGCARKWRLYLRGHGFRRVEAGEEGRDA